ncbi:menaquinone biosynthetic enzyme MqnA/MqnD family protein [Fuchsiella alkaliacetigena]|uniref:menaquinone biosynthetic enzyme MqnA/MqnD family protein n=1 Tax=Fuchsiella alkaliacetigena TaxID=957042 RepID=UPI00200AFD68|nr:menaquinone biosynthesis protein [Fuchsiella alkaliacetigena]MCK8825921.1 menaquinone biosynthesis protein [Fuchsiella alkaliacetigena]
MSWPLKLGMVDYINCWPVYYGLESGAVELEAELVKGPPAELNEAFLRGELDITPISSIEYARNFEECYILPNLAIASDGPVGSIFLFSRLDIRDFGGRKVALPKDSKSSIALLKILLKLYYQVEVDYTICKQSLEKMLTQAEAGLLIGDPALRGYIEHRDSQLQITDLGAAWKEFTAQKMVYAIWVIRKELAHQQPELVNEVSRKLLLSKELGLKNFELLAARAKKELNFSLQISSKYFNSLRYDFDRDYQQGVLKYFADAQQLGLLTKEVELQIWGEDYGIS